MRKSTHPTGACVLWTDPASVRSLWGMLFALALSGCTTIHSVAGGTRTGEFYALTTKSFLVFSTAPVVMRCTQRPADPRAFCQPVLTSAEAGEDQTLYFRDQKKSSEEEEDED